MHRTLIMLATVAPLCGCGTASVVERAAPPAVDVAPPSAIQAQAADRERIRAERERTLRNTPAGKVRECRQSFKTIYSRGIVDGLAVEVANLYLDVLSRYSKEGAEEQQLADAELLGFCYTARFIAASNSQKPVISAGSTLFDSQASARLDDMLDQPFQQCMPRIKDLNKIGVLSDEAMAGLFLYLDQMRQTLPDRPLARFLRGHCVAVSNVWLGLVL